MSKSSCVRTPENNRYIQLYVWQIKFCQDNRCAALLLAFFIGWHDWKIRNDQYYRRANDIAEMHGEGRPNNENAYMFFTMEELIDGVMGLYGKNSINEALQLLISLGVLSVHTNPNPRYHFDKTKYFQFYPDVCNQWIDEYYSVKVQKSHFDSPPIDFSDEPKSDDRFSKNNRRPAENNQPSSEKGRYITNTTNNTTNKNIQSINANDDVVDPIKSQTDNYEKQTIVQPIFDLLKQQGFASKHLNYPDVLETVYRLCMKGATPDVFLEAYARATKTSARGFGVNYLAKVIEDLLDQNKRNQIAIHVSPQRVTTEFNGESDISKGLDWIGNLETK